MKRLLGLGLLWSIAGFGSDYGTSLKTLNTNRGQIDQELKRLGFRDTKEPESGSQDGKTKTSLFQIYGNLGATQIPQGKLLFGRLINRIVVGGDGSPVLIEFDPDQGFLSGLRAMGVARPASTQGRVALEMNHLLLRSGKSISIQAVGLDETGAQGVVAQVISSKALAVAGSMAGSFISGLASAQQSQIPTGFGFSQVASSGRNGLLQGVAQTAADQSKRLIEEATTEKPVLIVEPDTAVILLIQEEVRL